MPELVPTPALDPALLRRLIREAVLATLAQSQAPAATAIPVAVLLTGPTLPPESFFEQLASLARTGRSLHALASHTLAAITAPRPSPPSSRPEPA